MKAPVWKKGIYKGFRSQGQLEQVGFCVSEGWKISVPPAVAKSIFRLSIIFYCES